MKENKTKIKFDILAIICIIIFSFVLSPVTLQNDTFYTIKIGEDILNNGIDMQDHYSWHQDLPYTYPHWAYDVIVYSVFNLGQMIPITDGGMWAIYFFTALLACILGILIYNTINKVCKNQLISFVLTLGAMYLMKDYIAARAQLVTFILFVLTILCIESFIETNKKRYLIGIVIISLIIANIHVAVWPFLFILFLPYIVEYIIAIILEKNIVSKINLFIKKQKVVRLEKKIQKVKGKDKEQKYSDDLEIAKKQLELQKQKEEKVIEKINKRREKPYKLKIEKKPAVKWLIIVIIICIFTGLITPLGDTPYTYLIKTMQGNTTKHISEHLPLTLFNSVEAMIVLGLVFAILIFTDTKIKLRDFFMIGGLIFLTFMSRRQFSMLIIIGVAIIGKWISYLFEKYDKNGSEKVTAFMTTIIGKILTLLLIILISLVIVKPKLKSEFIDSSKYPVEASKWILENIDIQNMKLYNEYNYGSYLVLKGIPVFIDSRADLYAPEFNKTEEYKDGRDIFTDYINISTINMYYETKMEEYEITHLITTNNSRLNIFISRDENYKELYKDDNFVIYERNVK